MMKSLLLVVVMLGLALGLSACGGGGGGASNSIHVTITDFAFSPNAFTVPAGAEISFNAVNNGAVGHSFVIMKAGYQVSGHFTDADKPNIFWSEPKIDPGQSVQGSFTAPSEPGEYQILCDVAGHLEAGMVGKLVVVAAP